MTAQPYSSAITDLLHKAQAEMARKQLDAATATLDSLLAVAPEFPPALGMAGIAAQLRGQYDRAVGYYRKALHHQPHDVGLRMGLGISLFESGDVDAAITALRRVCEAAPNAAVAWYNLGKALKLRVRTREAIEALQHALQLDPAHVRARLTLADAEASMGQVEEAATELRRVLQAQPGQAHAWFALVNLKVVKLDPGDVALLQREVEQAAGRPTEDRVLLGFALARALEDQGDIATSFEVLRRANRLQRRHARWDATAHRAHVGAIERAFTAPLAPPLDLQLGGEAILIASIPRSGSSLVEQILASHPDVEGANEIPDLPGVLDVESRRRGQAFPNWVSSTGPADWQRLGREYLARTTRWRDRKPRFTDKNLDLWTCVGAALAMLPAARVVVVRRDPLESCLACYRQWFAGGTWFSYDLDEMADYCIDFVRLSRFWLQRYPDRVFDLEYEALQSDPEPVIRRLLEFCGLPFDRACLAFHQTQRTVISAASAGQVRQPLRRDTARADRYGHLLDGLRQRLRDAGLA